MARSGRFPGTVATTLLPCETARMHAYVRLNGFGVTVVPRPPFRISREEASENVRVEHADRSATLVVGAKGVAPDVLGDVSVVRVTPTEYDAGWTLETSAFAFPWPAGFTLQSGPNPDVPPGFDLYAGDGRLIYPQGPYPSGKVNRDALVQPGARKTQTGTVGSAEFIECAYEAEDRPWKLRHYIFTARGHVLVITAQSPLEHADVVFVAADRLVDGLRFV